MKIGPVTASLGIADADELPEVAADALRGAALGFLQGGGHLSWSEWRTLTDDEREAFEDAGHHLREQLAGMIGAAVLSPGIAKAMMKGDDVEAVGLNAVLDQVTREIQAQAGRAE